MLVRACLFRFGSALCLSYQYVSIAVPFAACPFDSFSTRFFSIHFDSFSTRYFSLQFFSVANRVVANLFRCSALPRSSLPLLFCDIRCDSITCRSIRFRFHSRPFAALPFRFTLFLPKYSVPCRSFSTAPFPQVCRNRAIPLPLALTFRRAKAR